MSTTFQTMFVDTPPEIIKQFEFSDTLDLVVWINHVGEWHAIEEWLTEHKAVRSTTSFSWHSGDVWVMWRVTEEIKTLFLLRWQGY